MALILESLSNLTSLEADTVIDVRSPSEFAEDHLPEAINLPVLDDAERAKVGTIYKQESAFKARKIGAAIVSRNAARHIETRLAHYDGGWRPLVYCWRGGQRSGSFASILAQIGWRTETLAGGYQSYRRLIVRALYDTPWPTRVLIIDGNTGTAKTAILQRLVEQGAQVLDLEGLAAHRGSVLGPVGRPQPTQKAFESAIATALVGFRSDRPVVVEAESSKVGDLLVPPSLWAAMQSAPRVVIEAPVEARAAFLTRAYADLSEDLDALFARLDMLRSFHGSARINRWKGLARAGDRVTLAAELIVEHYDPRYEKSRARSASKVCKTLSLTDLEDPALDEVAEEFLRFTASQ